MAAALPERTRQARNVREGYEVLLGIPDGGEVWAVVVSALEILAPVAMVCLTVETASGEEIRLPAVHPRSDVMSRRPAGESGE